MNPGLIDRVRQLAKKHIKFLTLGVGTGEGGVVPDKNGEPMLDQNHQPITSALNTDELTRLAEAGNGFYQEASFQQKDSEAILQAAARSQISADVSNAKTRIWNERFYLLLIPLLALLLPSFRRHAARKGASSH